MARATQVPNCSWVKPIQLATKGKKITARAFKIKTIDKAVSSSSGFAFMTGATAAMAVPQQMAVPAASK